MKVLVGLFSTKVGRNLAPLVGLPLYDGVGDAMTLEPCFGSLDKLEELLRLGRALELGLARFLAHPTDGRTTIAIDGHLETLLVEHGKGMHDGEKLANVVGAMYRTKVEDFFAVTKVYTAILHGTGVATAGGINSKGVETQARPSVG